MRTQAVVRNFHRVVSNQSKGMTANVMVLLRKGVLTSGCTHVHTPQFRRSVNLQLYLSIQFGVVFALNWCSWVRWFSGSLLCRDFVEIVTKPVLSFKRGSDDSEPRSGAFSREDLCALPCQRLFISHRSRKGGVTFVNFRSKPVHQSSELVCGGVPLAKSWLTEWQ